MLVCLKCKNDILPTHKYIQNSVGIYHLDCYNKIQKMLKYSILVGIVFSILVTIAVIAIVVVV
ncbi:unknown transmembrane protein [Mesoplasma florum L1]|uniref:Uncharacterized protein n=1 Tax=Mesoplasma florum (strain ATCC 33453 / NBRC 100688 / NCTC 11704 / L1) TaxID=265311 RepID=Q6F128_MESFL|nr:hypothetical protein [Mesoplasma florum]AAT75795.1 unknown transmembrane protein [Mesoplasma florum L1]ATI74079.1 hypothetical protein CQZ70_02360 [Mesoplasma florum]